MNKLLAKVFQSNAKDFVFATKIMKMFVGAIGKFLVMAAPLLIIIIATFEGYIRDYIPIYIFIFVFFYFLLKISTMSPYSKRSGRGKKHLSIKTLYRPTPNKKFEAPKTDYQKITYDNRPKTKFHSAAITLGLSSKDLPSLSQVQTAYKEKMRRAHPDNGGNEALAKTLNNARDLLLKEIKLSAQART